MKKYSLFIIVSLSGLAFLWTGCSKKQESVQAEAPTEQTPAPVAAAVSQPAPVATPATQPSPPSAQAGDRRLVKVATIEGSEKNAEFQRNLNLVNKQKQIVIALKNKMEQSTDANEQAQLKEATDKALAKLNENNQKMLKAYGFTLTRNYSYVIEQSSIYMAVSEEEANKVVAK